MRSTDVSTGWRGTVTRRSFRGRVHCHSPDRYVLNLDVFRGPGAGPRGAAIVTGGLPGEHGYWPAQKPLEPLNTSES